MRRIIMAIGLSIITILSLGACAQSTEITKPFIVIKSPTADNRQELTEVVAQALAIKKGSKDYLIVNNAGKNVTKDHREDLPDTEGEMVRFLFKLMETENVRIVEKGKYRVTNWKKEIDAFFKNKRSITQVNRDQEGFINPIRKEEFETREKFIQETEQLYKEKKYEEIILHTEMQEYTIYSLRDDLLTEFD